MKLIDGRQIDDSDVTFDSSSYHFFIPATAEDITNVIYRRDKLRLVPDFDITKENYRLSAEIGHGAKFGDEPLDESTTNALTDQLIHDPLGAPLAALDSGVKQLFSGSGIRTLLLIGGAVLVVVLVIKTK